MPIIVFGGSRIVRRHFRPMANPSTTLLKQTVAGWIPRISRILVLIAAATCYVSLHAQNLPSDEPVEKVEWQGEALVEVGPFGLDVYIARFFDSGTGLKLIELEYLRDVMQKFSLMGWDKGLAVFDAAVYQDAVVWIKEKTPDIKEGDRFTVRVDQMRTTIWLNGEVIGETNDPVVAQIILSPWVGEHPVDENVKQKLLGGNA